MDDLVLRGAADVWGHGPGDVVVRGGEVVAIGPGAATGAGGRYDGPAGERVEVVEVTHPVRDLVVKAGRVVARAGALA